MREKPKIEHLVSAKLVLSKMFFPLEIKIIIMIIILLISEKHYKLKQKKINGAHSFYSFLMHKNSHFLPQF